MRRRLALGLAFSLLLLATLPSRSEARCRPAVGYTLARIGDGPIAPGGTMLLTYRPVYEASQTVEVPLTTVTVRRRGRRSPLFITPRAVAANLFAFELPTDEGHYMITPASLEVDVAAATVAPRPVTTAPALASPPLGSIRSGSVSRSTTLELGTPAPPEAIGVVLRWAAGSWFAPAGRMVIGPGRCTPEIAGYTALTETDPVTMRFVDGSGGEGPEVSFTSALP